MRRRRLLALAGATAPSLSGCFGGDRTATDDPDSERPSPTAATAAEPGSMGTTVTFADDTTLLVGTPTVQRSIVADAKAVRSVEARDGVQYVVVEVTGTRATAASPSAFALERDGDLVSPPGENRAFLVEGVLRDCSVRCIGLPFVAEPAGTATVVYRPGERAAAAWELPAETVARFDERPPCVLQDAALTERDGAVALRVTVANRGERDAAFRALVAPAWQAFVTDPLGVPVPAGTTVTETVVPPSLGTLAPGEAAFTHAVEGDTRTFEVGRTAAARDDP